LLETPFSAANCSNDAGAEGAYLSRELGPYDVHGRAQIIGCMVMVLVSIQTGIQPAVTRLCVSKEVSGQSLVLAENLVSMVIAIVLSPPGAFHAWSFEDSFACVGPAAFVYVIRSLFKQAAYRRCDGVTFNICNQTKVVFCAFATWFLIEEGQTPQQMCALLCAVSAGVLLVAPGVGARPSHIDGNVCNSLPSSVATDASQAGSQASTWLHSSALSAPALGTAFALITACCSGTGAALSQVAMRNSERPSTLFNFELAMWGMPLAIIVSTSSGSGVKPTSLTTGWEIKTLAPVALQACGGLLVSSVVKRHGGVAMGLCTVAGIAVSASADALLTGQPPTARQCVAGTLAALSIAMHQIESPLIPLPWYQNVWHSLET